VYADSSVAVVGQNVSKNKRPEGKIGESSQIFRNKFANGIESDTMNVRKDLEGFRSGFFGAKKVRGRWGSMPMQNIKLGTRTGALASRPDYVKLAACRTLAALVVVAMAFAIPSRCAAQTLELGPDSSYGIFLNHGGDLMLSGSKISGGLDANKSPTEMISGSTITGTTNNQAAAVIDNLPRGVAGSSTSGLNPTYTAATSGTVSTFSLNNFNLSGQTMTLKGAAGDTFIFNTSGSFTLSGVTMKLIGIQASQVVFIGSNFMISGSTVFGTFYNSATSGSTMLSGDQLTGSVVAANDGIVSVSGSTINAAPLDPPAAAAPETPTIMTAGLAAVLFVGSSCVNCLRRKRAPHDSLRAQWGNLLLKGSLAGASRRLTFAGADMCGEILLLGGSS
jgi:hypothetical protein